MVSYSQVKIRISSVNMMCLSRILNPRKGMSGAIRNLVLYFSFFSFIVLSLVSCASKTDQALTGKWQEVNGKEEIEFLKDGSFHGTLIWDLTKQLLEVSGTYSVKDDIVDLKLEKPSNLAPMTWKVTFSGSRNGLTFVYQQGGAVKLDGSSAAYRKIT